MKYIKFTYVDAVTGISVAKTPAINGPVFPQVDGLQFVWARESQYPTDEPQFFGTCPDSSNTEIEGVIAVLVQADFDSMQADEMAARAAKVALDKQITRLAFRNRFTQAEKVLLEIASLDNPAASMPTRQQSAALRVYLADVAVATKVQLERADTRAGVLQLESLGLLAAGRALEILDAPVQPVERPAA